jgi:hypothetical protein
MSQSLIYSSTALRTLAILSGLVLGSCQTNAGDILATGTVESASGTEPSTKAAYRDPQVVIASAQKTPKTGELPLTEPAASLKRKPVPMAAAYSDIAEPPPEVLALQQQTMSTGTAPQDLGVLESTAVDTGSNSLFSAGRRQNTPSPDTQAAAPQQAEPQNVATTVEPGSSLVPANMPTLGVNAMSKSLFSPSGEQQILPEPEQAPAPAAGVAVAEPDNDPPVLHKLSDPRPKRKMLALREPTATVTAAVPDRVQLTPAQLEAMGAVPETSGDSATVAAATPDDSAPAPKPKKKWLSSLSKLLGGGTKAPSETP